MYAALELEWLGQDIDQAARAFRDVFGGKVHWKPWVARIIGFSPTYGFERKFLQPRIDYAKTNRRGSRGIMCCYLLPEGAYEIRHFLAWKHERRYFAIVCDGTVFPTDKEGVEQWLSDHVAS